jgi:translocation and assembly module TamA
VRAFQLISAILGVMLFIPLYLASPVVIADVAVTGLRSETQRNVQLVLSLAKENCESPEWKIRGLFDKADDEISQALRALGYYHPVIKKSLAFNDKCWRADFTIDSGPQTIVADIAIDLIGDARPATTLNSKNCVMRC